jgi:signal transduction histidine kinase
MPEPDNSIPRVTDEELLDRAEFFADMLRVAASRWRSRVESGRLGGHELTDVLRHAEILEDAAGVLDWNSIRDAADRDRAVARLRLARRATAVLAESLDDYETTLEKLAQVAVPTLADWCVVDLLEDGALRRVAVSHRDPAKTALVQELQDRYPPDFDGAQGSGAVVRTGEPLLVSEVTEEFLEGGARDQDHLAILRELGLASFICVPLVARGRVLGAISLASAPPATRYGHEELELAIEVAHRAAIAVDNARLYREAQEAIRVRDEFLMVASHELKTPLTPLKLMLENLHQVVETYGADDERVKRRFEIAARQTRRLAGLVDTLLEVYRITAGRLELFPKEVDLAQLVNEVVVRFAEHARLSGSTIDVRADGPVIGWWDPGRVEQVAASLLSNAVKYGAGAPIEVTVESTDEEVRVAVRDHGMGVAEDDVRRIFRLFERVASMRHYGGLGLGLFVASRIAEAHGGSIAVDSTPGNGATFTIVLPRDPAGRREPADCPATRCA